MSDFSRRSFLYASGAVAGGTMLLNKDALALQAGSKPVRKEVRSLPPAELKKFRDAFRTLVQTAGFDGFETIAGYHGNPGNYCHRDGRIFLPWHRAYVFRIEAALRKIDSSVSMPYWDWTSTASIREGIPEAYSAPDVGGQPNPLFSGPVGPDNNRPTTRNPKAPRLLAGYARLVNRAYNQRSYIGFNNAIDVPHGNLHTWVRGDMVSTTFAAYDPIFFAHHSNVDFQWAQWQAGPNNADPTSDLARILLPPFKNPIPEDGNVQLRASDVVDYKNDLGYSYEGLQSKPNRPSFELAGLGRAEDDVAFAIPPNRSVHSVVLNANGVGTSEQSFFVQAFLNKPDANIGTSVEDASFAGSFGFFGHGAHQHKADSDTMNVAVLDLTEQVTALRADGVNRFQVKLVVSDGDGKATDMKSLPFKTLSVDID